VGPQGPHPHGLSVQHRGKREAGASAVRDEAEAQTELDKFKNTLKRPALKPMTLHEAIELYLRTKAEKRSLSGDRRASRCSSRHGVRETPLTEITSSLIATWQIGNRGRAGGKWDNVTAISTATTNRPLACLRHLLRLAWRRWEVLTVVPHIELDREPEGRLRFLDEQEIARLMSACTNPERSPMLAGIVAVALNTGMRRGEILGLTWDRVDSSRGVIVLTTGGHEERQGPRGADDPDRPRSALRDAQPHTGRVFPLSSIDESYRVALRESKDPRRQLPHSSAYVRLPLHAARGEPLRFGEDPRARQREDYVEIRASLADAPPQPDGPHGRHHGEPDGVKHKRLHMSPRPSRSCPRQHAFSF